MDTAQPSKTSTNRKMKLAIVCITNFKLHSLKCILCLILRIFSAQQMLQNFGSFPLFYCNAGMEVEGTRLQLFIALYQSIKTK
jgi:hypothetical protein